MAATVSRVSTLASLPPTVSLTRPATAAKPTAVFGADTVATPTLTDANLRARLEPVLQLMAEAGFAKEAARVRKAHITLTEGKSFGVEYYAAAYPFNLITLNRHTFKNLSNKELASVLIHESTHLEQGLLLKGYSNVRSLGGRKLKHSLSEKAAYLKQQRANQALGLTSGEMVWTTNEALKEMGLPVHD